MNLKNVRNTILKSNGKIFRVEFIKRTTGELRTMFARIGVAKNLTGDGLAFDPLKKGLLTVFDMAKAQYRMINLDAVVAFAEAKNEYARWFCDVVTPMCPDGEMGDVYVREIKANARRIK